MERINIKITNLGVEIRAVKQINCLLNGKFDDDYKEFFV